MTLQPASHWELRPVRCPICEAEDARFLGYRGGWAHHRRSGIASPIVECTACKLVYPSPTPFPRDHSHYDSPAEYFAGDHFGPAKIDEVVGILGRAKDLGGGSAGSMLDIGCGCGESLRAAQLAGWNAVGVEPSKEFVDTGRREFGVSIQHGFVEDAGLPDESFDLVMLSGVLEHVYNPLELLREARRLVKAEGLVYIDVPNERSLYLRVGRIYLRMRRRDWCLALSPTFPPYHVVGFSPRSMRVALERARMRAVSLRTYPIEFSSQPGIPPLMAAVSDLVERSASCMNSAAGLVVWAKPA